MIARRYQVTFTDRTQCEMDRLVSDEECDIRGILNAGIMLYVKATPTERAVACMEANARPQTELQRAIDTIKKAVVKMDPEISQRIRAAFGPDGEVALKMFQRALGRSQPSPGGSSEKNTDPEKRP